MKLTVTGRKMKITQGIEDHLNSKIERTLKTMTDSADVHVALTVEKHRHFAELTVKDRGFTVHSDAETEDLYAAMDQAVEKTEKQLKKHKERSVRLKIKKSSAEKDKLSR